MKHCKECKDGEHENYDDDVRKTTVKDPDGNERTRTVLLCGEHRAMLEMDGYELTSTPA